MTNLANRTLSVRNWEAPYNGTMDHNVIVGEILYHLINSSQAFVDPVTECTDIVLAKRGLSVTALQRALLHADVSNQLRAWASNTSPFVQIHS